MSEKDQIDILRALVEDPERSGFDSVMAADALRFSYAHDKDTEAACRYATYVIDMGTKLIAKHALDGKQGAEVYDALKRAYTTKAPFDFHCFLIAMEWDRPAVSRFYLPRSKVMKPVVDVLTDMMVADAYDIVLFSMPPRVGKSELGKMFTAWIAGREPDNPNLITSYTNKVTKGFYDELMLFYDDKFTYRYREIFPTLVRVGNSAQDEEIDFRNDGKPYPRNYKTITCRSIDSAMNGAIDCRGVLYCDDLVSGIEEAMSLDRLDNLWDKFTANARGRKKSGAKELHIGTRWSIYDPIGRIEADNENNPRCKVIRLPALDAQGHSNFEYKYGVGFDAKSFAEKTSGLDEVTFQCEYQQEPIEREGLLFHSDDFDYLMTPFTKEYLEQNPPDDIFAFCDVGFGGSDYLAMPIAYQWGDDITIVDAVFDASDYKITQPKVIGALKKHNVKHVSFEANNGGDFYARDIARLMKEAGIPINITSKRAPNQQSKISRIVQHAPEVKSLRFLETTVRSREYKAFMQNVLTFNQNGKNKHDDAPDALTGLVMMLGKNAPTVKVLDRRYI